MTRQHRVAAVLVGAAAGALIVASAGAVRGSAAHLEVDGGTLQVFSIDAPSFGGPPGKPNVPSGPPDNLPPGPPDSAPPESAPPHVHKREAGQPQHQTRAQAAGRMIATSPDEQADSKPGQQAVPTADEQPGTGTGPRADSNQAPTNPVNEDQQVTAERQATSSTAGQPTEPKYEDCTAVREKRTEPLTEQDPGYRPELDPDQDGVACEQQLTVTNESPATGKPSE